MIWKIRIILLDILISVFVGIVILVIFKPFWNANYINTTYPDWVNHAYRSMLIKNYGITPWINLTGNGQDIWQAFQFIPHYITAKISILTNLSIMRVMILTTLFLLFLLYSSIYILLRLFGVGSYLAFASAILLMQMPQLTNAVQDYTLLFGLTLSPLLIFFIYRSYNLQRISTVPALIGTSTYIHPILAFFSGGYWVLTNIPTLKKRWTSFLIELVLVLIISSYYLISVFGYDGEFYYDHSQRSVEFVRALLTYPGLGLGRIIYLFLVISIPIMVFKKYPSSERSIIAFFYLLILFLWIFATYQYNWIPKFINNFQITRWTPFMAILGVMLGSIILNSYIKTNMLKIILPTLILVLCFIEMNDPSNRFSILRYVPQGYLSYTDTYSNFLEWNTEYINKKVNVFSLYPQDHVYFHPETVTSESTYFHFTPNPTNLALKKYVLYGDYYPNGFNILEAYSSIRDIDLMIIPKETRTNTFIWEKSERNDSHLRYLGDYEDSFGKIFSYYSFNNKIGNFYTTDYSNVSFSEYQTEGLTNEIDKYVIDYYKEHANSNQKAPETSFPSQNKIKITDMEPNSSAILAVNYDPNWETSDSSIRIERMGPGYIGIINGSNNRVTVELIKKFPTMLKLGWQIALTGIASWLILYLKEIIFRAKPKGA